MFCCTAATPRRSKTAVQQNTPLSDSHSRSVWRTPCEARSTMGQDARCDCCGVVPFAPQDNDSLSRAEKIGARNQACSHSEREWLFFVSS